MNKYQTFIEQNNLEVKDLPKGIRQKMKIFERMHSRYDHLHQQDQKKLKDKLTSLDLEIHEDLLETFQDQLENNEYIEEVSEPSTDEALVEQYFRSGIYRVGRSELRKRGFSGDLPQKELIVGRFRLIKMRFTHSYRIVLQTPQSK